MMKVGVGSGNKIIKGVGSKDGMRVGMKDVDKMGGDMNILEAGVFIVVRLGIERRNQVAQIFVTRL